jgi:hypothetical protein
VAALRPLGTKVGIVLLQLPPSLSAEEGKPRLEELLDEEAIPAPIAVEARHESWSHPSVYSMLDQRDVTWVWSDNDRWASPSARTSSTAYLRFIGDRELDTFDELQRDPEPRIQQRWADLEMQKDAIDTIHVYANNHFAGFGPGTANAFLRVAGQQPREWGADEQGGQRGSVSSSSVGSLTFSRAGAAWDGGSGRALHRHRWDASSSDRVTARAPRCQRTLSLGPNGSVADIPRVLQEHAPHAPRPRRRSAGRGAQGAYSAAAVLPRHASPVWWSCVSL